MAYGDIDPNETGDTTPVPPPTAHPPVDARPAPEQPVPDQPVVRPEAPTPDKPTPDQPTASEPVPGQPAPAGVAVGQPADLPPGLLPAPKRKRGLLVGLVVTFVVLLLAVPALVVLTSGSPDEPATAAAPSPTASATPTGPPASPQPGDPPFVKHAWAKARITDSLAAMNKAMRDGNLGAFVKPAADKKIRAELERRFRSLRAMKASAFTIALDSGPTDDKPVGGFDQWGVGLSISHCYVVTSCENQKLLVDTVWRDSAKGYQLVTFSNVTNANGPQPWEVSTLTAAVGSRAIVAAPAALSSRARSFLPAAERAAKIADRYVLGEKPDRYVVYLAGASDWKKWFGGTEDWAIGFAIPSSDERSDIVLRADELSRGYAESVMKHEMGHVATLAGRDYRDYNGENWWLTEGIAEYVEWDGRPVNAYDRELNSRRMVREKKFKGDLEKLVPKDNAPDWQIDGAYGLGYYATRCIADQYGHDKLMRFADAVLRGGRPSAAEAEPILGVDWPTVTKRCFTYTKQKVG
ncbi:hypothetical protein [Asanoa siamensis]|uniref:Uncharacterized protein n=1 Tax=Asanoa siamensis TaxID=926357 RepID=A0ABQ4CR31_9ACTN|nr:hypothetical protein [Asanoa siamensis]GIF73448.1 hypothetical protein Asi02nite_29660 [Asanoa siamensis]